MDILGEKEKYFDREKLHALFKWYLQEAGNQLLSVLVVGQDGLLIDVLTREKIKEEQKKFVGAFSALVDVVIRKFTKEFDLGTFGAGTFDTDKYRFVFCEAGLEYVLVSIFDALTMIDDVIPYAFIAADKVSRIIYDLPVSPVIPKLSKDRENDELRIKLAAYRKEKVYAADYIYKLSLVGNGGVGKTSMVQRYVKGVFTEDYKATIGTFITKKEVVLEDYGTQVRFMLWDLAGQEQFKRIWPDYMADSSAGIIVFDVTKRKSFDDVENWYAQIKNVALPGLQLILVGNKIDLEDKRIVSQEEGKQKAKKLGIQYLETSAKTNYNLESTFEIIALQLIGAFTDGPPEMEEKITKDSKYIITGGQLEYLKEYFLKQLDYCIDKNEITKFMKYIDIVKDIEKRNF